VCVGDIIKQPHHKKKVWCTPHVSGGTISNQLTARKSMLFA
tara:strand:+ start:1039 stop:1161 length:123 start_codon:yes stop_codon:yes gene_type:complete